MRNTSLSIFCFVVLTGGVGFSKAELQLSDIHGRNFSTILVEDARVLAERAGNAGTGRIADAFVQAVMKSGRLELMELCWENRYVSGLFWDEYRKIPEGHLKDQLFSSRLRNPRIYWPDNKPGEVSNGNGTPRMSLAEYFVPILCKYVPDLPMDYETIGSREKRLKLADAFDKAAGIPIVVEPEARRVWPPNRDERMNAPGKPTEQRNDAGKPNETAVVATINKGNKPSPPSERFAIFAAVTAVLAGIVGWLVLRSRQRK